MNNTDKAVHKITSKDIVTILICVAIIGLFFVEGGGPLLISAFLIVLGCLFTQKGRAFLASLGKIDFSNRKEAAKVIFGAYLLLIILNFSPFFPTPDVPIDEAFFSDTDTDTNTDTAMDAVGISILLFSLGAMIFAAVMEEIIFRGYLLTRLIRVFGDGKMALYLIVGITALVFGAGHYYISGIGSFIDATIFSIVVSIVFIKYKFNLGYVIGIHVLNNALSVIGM